MKPKKVFISYAHESEAIANAVLNLSNSLRSKGIDAEIDQYEESPPEGWPKWMMRQVQEADFVLVVCTKLFFERANDFSGSESGLGVKWETSLILQQLYTASTNNTKYIPVVLGHEGKIFIPLPLQPYTYYNIEDAEKISSLIARIKGTSKSKRPPLGDAAPIDQESSPLPTKERKTLFFSSVIDIDLWNEAKWKAMAFLSDPSLEKPPVIGFVFENNQKGKEIFAGLRARFGEFDENDEIRLSFIENISASRPQDYKIQINTDWEVATKRMKEEGLKLDSSLLMSVGRIHEMNPPSGSKNLAVFKHAYSYFKKYYITNFELHNGQLKPDFDNLIEKRRIHFRQKSDIIGNKNDPDHVVFIK